MFLDDPLVPPALLVGVLHRRVHVPEEAASAPAPSGLVGQLHRGRVVGGVGHFGRLDGNSMDNVLYNFAPYLA